MCQNATWKQHSWMTPTWNGKSFHDLSDPLPPPHNLTKLSEHLISCITRGTQAKTFYVRYQVVLPRLEFQLLSGILHHGSFWCIYHNDDNLHYMNNSWYIHLNAKKVTLIPNSTAGLCSAVLHVSKVDLLKKKSWSTFFPSLTHWMLKRKTCMGTFISLQIATEIPKLSVYVSTQTISCGAIKNYLWSLLQSKMCLRLQSNMCLRILSPGHILQCDEVYQRRRKQT